MSFAAWCLLRLKLGCLQGARADLQKIAASLNQAQDVYKAFKSRRAELNKAVEALQLMSEWQVDLRLISYRLQYSLPGATFAYLTKWSFPHMLAS